MLQWLYRYILFLLTYPKHKANSFGMHTVELCLYAYFLILKVKNENQKTCCFFKSIEPKKLYRSGDFEL